MLQESRRADSTLELPEPDLTQLFEVVALNFPYPILLTRVAVGDVLPLQLHTLGRRVGLMVLCQDRAAGYISLENHPELTVSLHRGQQYEAVVSQNFGGHCRVLIRPRK